MTLRFDSRHVMWASEVGQRFGDTPKPCPFCCSGNVGLYMGPSPHVTCLDCGADGPLPDGTTVFLESMAVRLWNQRGAS